MQDGVDGLVVGRLEGVTKLTGEFWKISVGEEIIAPSQNTVVKLELDANACEPKIIIYMFFNTIIHTTTGLLIMTQGNEYRKISVLNICSIYNIIYPCVGYL